MPKCNQDFVIKGNKAGFCEYESLVESPSECALFIIFDHKVLGGSLFRKKVKLRPLNLAQ